MAHDRVKVPDKQWEPSPMERDTLAARRMRAAERPAPLRVTVDCRDATAQLQPDHPDPQAAYSMAMTTTFGTASPEFMHGLLVQLANASATGRKPDPESLNFMLAAMHGIEPADEVEAMLAAQMAAIHMATMRTVRTFNGAQTIEQFAAQTVALNKLARTFGLQVEALKRYRTGGEQRVTVKHVTVNEGGQAIVGAVQTGGGRHKKPTSTP